MDDNGFYLGDSQAIATYLVNKYAKDDSLYPKDIQIRAKVDQRLHFNSGVLFPSLRQCSRAVTFEGACEQTPASLEAINQAYTHLNNFLEGQSYLVGNTLTLADFSCVTTTTQLGIFLPLDAKFKNIRAWIERIERLPYFEELNTIPLNNVKKWFADKLAENRANNK